MPALRSFILAFCVCAAALPAAAQDRETKSDTLYYSGGVLSDSASVDPSKTYDLGEVVVGGAQNAPAARVTTVQAVPLAAIERTDAATVADIARLVPAASVQTNSRGETLVYLRNVGERQVAFFYDGALLNVPWDNRVDLSLVPASTVGRINIAKGAPSVLYGANVSGGVVNFVSRSLETEGQFTEAAMMAGTGSSRRGSVTHLRNSGDWRFLGSAGYVTREAIPIPNGSELPFGQIDDDRRTNTDLELFNVLLRGERAFGPNQRVAVSLLHFDGDKGIAPQSHIDPARDRVRYWRYPTWRTSMLIGKGRTPAAGGILQGTIWASRFEQTIDQFESVAYASLGERQEDLDMTVGARLVFARPLGAGTVQLGLNALTSSHGQTDLDIAGGGTPFDQTYRQHVGSVGAEYEVPLAARTQLVAGLTFDALLTPETGDKPARDAQSSYGALLGLSHQLANGITLRGSAGRKTRFPSLRELFGEALGTFLDNPDLKPERSILLEAGAQVSRDSWAGEFALFGTFTDDTIDRVSVTVDGTRLRQRVNIPGSRVFGIEVAGTARPAPRWSVDGHLTLMRPRGFDEEEDSYTALLSEKPAGLGLLGVQYRTPSGFMLRAEADYTGPAYSPDVDDTLVRLDPAVRLNARLSWLGTLAGTTFEPFLRLDNLNDAEVLPQLGLPAAGREIRGGVKAAF